MGLDMYMIGITDNKISQKQANIGIREFDTYDVAYWRKHADLNYYFNKIAAERIPRECMPEEGFNCVPLVLDKNDIQELLDKINNNEEFEKGRGFFWGATEPEHWTETIEICEDILDSFDFEKDTLIYYCWW